MPFARAVTDMIEEMKTQRKGCPQLPQKLPPAFETLTQFEWYDSDVWKFAGVTELYAYLRGAAALKIPQDWKPYFPKKL